MSKNESVVQLGQVLKDRLSGNLMLLVIVNHNHWPAKEKHSVFLPPSVQHRYLPIQKGFLPPKSQSHRICCLERTVTRLLRWLQANEWRWEHQWQGVWHICWYDMHNRNQNQFKIEKTYIYRKNFSRFFVFVFNLMSIWKLG